MKRRAGFLAAGLMAAALALGGCAGMGDRLSGEDREEAADINAELGLGYLREGEVDQAETNLKRALEFDRRHALANLGMAAVYERREDYERAEDHYRTALRSDSRNPYVQTSLGALLCRRGAFDEAQDLFAKAASNPEYDQRHVALMNAGVCYVDEGRTEEAEKKLREALNMQPRYGQALLELATLAFEDGRPMQTRAFLQRLESLGVENAHMLLLCYQAETALGNRRAAGSCAQTLRRNYADSDEMATLRRLEADGG